MRRRRGDASAPGLPIPFALSIAPRSLARKEGGPDDHLKFAEGALAARAARPTPPPAGRKRVLRGAQRCVLRSVDSEPRGRAIEPRNGNTSPGSSALLYRTAASRAPGRWWREGPDRGLRTRQAGRQGAPGTWESPPFPPEERRYRSARDNRSARNRRRAVGARRSTEEPGEPTRGTRRREGRAGTRNRTRERCRGR